MLIDKIADDFLELSDANRPIKLHLCAQDGPVEDKLLVHRVHGRETICGGIAYTIDCLSRNAGLALKQFIAAPIQLQFVTAAGRRHAISGVVREVDEGGTDGGLASYRLLVSDAFSLLELSCNTRVFRDASEVDITRIILSEWRLANPVAAQAFQYDISRLQHYPVRPFTMQYNESTAAFLRRLWKRRGIGWFFESGPIVERASQIAPFHRLVLFDSSYTLEENPAGRARFQRDHATGTTDGIYAWQGSRSLAAGRLSRRSWDYRRTAWIGNAFPTLADQGHFGNAFAGPLDDYLVDAPQEDIVLDDYRAQSERRMQSIECEAKQFRGESGDRDMRVGMWRRIDGHAEIDTHPPGEREFIVTSLHIAADNNLPKPLDARVRRLYAANGWDPEGATLYGEHTAREMRYANRFTCVRRSIPIVPAYDPRVELPRTPPQTAIVVGPTNNEIHCDAAGRIRIHFPATRPEDHVHAGGEQDSAWVRVATSWAGNKFGAISLPRVGDEVIVIFLGGDPDRPLVVGSVHGARTPPPSFSGTSVLPGDRHLSGIVSKEADARRMNQLRMDDTPGKISAQLSSDHAHSQLNLGYLTHPRCNGDADMRGHGAELRTDATLALRGGSGILISADAALRAAGAQLARDGMQSLAETLAQLQQYVAHAADTHHASGADSTALNQLCDGVRRWDANGETADTVVGNEAAPIIAVDAPAGMLVCSRAGLALAAQSHIDTVSVGNTQVSAGRRLLLHAMESVSIFAHALGVRLIAASGKVEIASHDADIELTSARRIVLSASEEIILQAPNISIVTTGAQAKFGNGDIRQECTGTFDVKSAMVAFAGGGDGAAPKRNLPVDTAAHDQRVRMVDMSTGASLLHQRYRITLEDGQVIEGKTDAEGLTQVFTSDTPFAKFNIEALDN